MILETLPDVQKLSKEEKTLLAEELLDDLNAPTVSGAQERAMLEVLNERMEAYRQDRDTGSSWTEAKKRLQRETGASWES